MVSTFMSLVITQMAVPVLGLTLIPLAKIMGHQQMKKGLYVMLFFILHELTFSIHNCQEVS